MKNKKYILSVFLIILIFSISFVACQNVRKKDTKETKQEVVNTVLETNEETLSETKKETSKTKKDTKTINNNTTKTKTTLKTQNKASKQDNNIKQQPAKEETKEEIEKKDVEKKEDVKVSSGNFTQKENVQNEEKQYSETNKQTPKVEEETKEVKLQKKDEPKEKVWVVDVKAQEAVYETKCVVTKEAWTETTDELIDFTQIIKPRWFVKEFDSGKIHYFYSYDEAVSYSDEIANKGIMNHWGTAEDEEIITDKVYKTIEHPEEKTCEDVLIKEAVQEQGHWEYR